MVGLGMHIAGVVVTFGQNCSTNIGQRTNIERVVTLWWYTMSLIRGIVPWKRDVEHPMKEAVHYVTNVADSHLVVETFHRVRFP